VIVRRLGLPEDVSKATELLSRIVIMIRMAQMSFNLLMLGTPYGWAMGAAGVILTAFSAADTIQGLGG
jgi:hypothetical protein